MMTTSETKKMDSKLVIDKADITEDTSIVCLYDTDHVKTESTLDVVRKFAEPDFSPYSDVIEIEVF